MFHMAIEYIVGIWTNILTIKSSCRGIILQDHLILYCSKLEVTSDFYILIKLKMTEYEYRF